MHRYFYADGIMVPTAHSLGKDLSARNLVLENQFYFCLLYKAQLSRSISRGVRTMSLSVLGFPSIKSTKVFPATIPCSFFGCDTLVMFG